MSCDGSGQVIVVGSGHFGHTKAFRLAREDKLNNTRLGLGHFYDLRQTQLGAAITVFNQLGFLFIYYLVS